jgi:hypothetical protein
VQYDPSAKPFFVSQVVEDLRRISTKEVGRELLKQIADARPRSRSALGNASAEVKAIKFSKGINVVMVPTSVAFTQSGYKMAFTGRGMEKSLTASTAAPHNIKDCPFHIAGGSCAEAVDIMAAGNGTGTVSIMKYTNAQIITGKGEATSSFIVLAHELIHSLHHVTGTRKDNAEELWTTGLGIYADELMTENTFRKMFGLPPRVDY